MSDELFGRTTSADRLRRLLAASDNPMRLYQTEALYKIQVDYTCQLLDAVDEVTDEFTATMIMSVIYEKLAGQGASAAAQRIRDARAEMERLAKEPVRLPFMPDRHRWRP
jgi:hypothetical protein